MKFCLEIQKDAVSYRSEKNITYGKTRARENLFRPEGNNIKAIPLCIEQRRGKGVGTRKIHADYDDYQKVKMIIEAITI